MPLLLNGCLSIYCISRKKRKSFSVHETQHETEINKICLRHIENIRNMPSTTINHEQDEKIDLKETVKSKSDNVESQCETHVSDQQTKTTSTKDNNTSYSQISLLKFFHKSKQLKTPSPLPMTIDDISEDNYDKTINNTLSSWSSSTNSDSNQHTSRSKHRSFTESYDVNEQSASQTKNMSPTKKISNDVKSLDKNKLVLVNVRKLIKNQNME
ncbi:unnamed protein product [Rotaria sp. Silwood1]|nr:unnamed protein product [Rotaria sp. Silwood1]CAF1195049.1 unnamed protein product [Rotaria sp. Silwood1]CAF3454588.1 unnamed protein product [Rotaria sp. Silwood1]CAF3468450.1 unnamed protein product [Rotaria sp. Silwood1]CAF4515174.1 unnamed protein product [Rotaria sp. Silwood1]